VKPSPRSEEASGKNLREVYDAMSTLPQVSGAAGAVLLSKTFSSLRRGLR